ncbi:MAG: GGDEF domain-containing protein [Oscillospiraceae bacterium]|nr:GGDEF domain-containing protein [Oscillospiraceae bacterium]
MDLASMKKFAAIVNAVILGLVFGLASFFFMIKVDFLVYFSIPTAMIYIAGFYFINKGMLDSYVWMVYTWLTFYMGVTTICLGYGYGFHLYCFSMIPVIFVTEYISYRLRVKPKIKALNFSIGLAVFYLICTGYVAYFGPVYERDQKAAAFFWIFNGLTVFCFLIYYTNYLIRTTISSEEQLKEIAHFDQLTGLYNRHFMLERLGLLTESGRAGMLAMVDIDNFKKINDTYGHNAGDMVLETVAALMRREFPDCEISRWGGEEFLILIPKDIKGGEDMPENLRRAVEAESLSFEDNDIAVTVTVGVSFREEGQSVDKWIQTVDEKLYIGKNSGKNKVVS